MTTMPNKTDLRASWESHRHVWSRS